MNPFAKYFDRNLVIYQLIKKNLIVNQCKMKNTFVQCKFSGNKTPRENECYNYFSVLLLDSIANVDKKCYQQIFSEECKYPAKKEKYRKFH